MSPIESITNFRSVGGMPAAGGEVRAGLLFRSGDLADLTDADANELRRLNIQLICDLRSDRERAVRASRIPESWEVKTLTYDLASPTSGTLLKLMEDDALQAQDVINYLRNRNRDFATILAPRFGQLIRDVASLPKHAGALIHCAAGKDRTGFAVALIQFALGVSERDVLNEYLATRKYLDAAALARREIEAFERAGLGTIDPESYRPMTEVRPEYLESALVHIRRAGVSSFLHEHANITVDTLTRLRGRMIEAG